MNNQEKESTMLNDARKANLDLLAACWKEQGIVGNASCSHLKKFGHCRHCPEYTRAGRRLFDRPIPKGLAEEWAAVLAGEKEVDNPESVSVVVFRLHNQLLALPSTFFIKAQEARPVQRLPGRRNHVLKGLVNVDGELLPCVSLVAIMAVDQAVGGVSLEQQDYPRQMVVAQAAERFVFPVDEALGVHRILPTPLRSADQSVSAMISSVFLMAERRVGLLDEQKLFSAFQRSLIY